MTALIFLVWAEAREQASRAASRARFMVGRYTFSSRRRTWGRFPAPAFPRRDFRRREACFRRRYATRRFRGPAPTATSRDKPPGRAAAPAGRGLRAAPANPPWARAAASA